MKMNNFVIAGAFFLFVLILAGCQSESPSNTGELRENQEEDSAEYEQERTGPAAKQEEENRLTEAPREELQKLDESEDVELLQQVLNEIGYEVETSGIYDDATTWAITDLQLQFDELMVTGIYDKDTNQALNDLLQESDDEFPAGEALPVPSEEVTTSHGSVVLANPYEQLVLVNKEFALPEDYIPEDLVVPDIPFPFEEDLPQKQMREIAAEPLEKMFQAADEAGLELYAQSGYRSYERQDAIFASNAGQHGEEEANTFSARPGESEHQTGLTMDVTSPDVDFTLTVDFAETDEGKWVQEHAAYFGFIIRYPEGKEDITEYQYEPWHLRYVGEEAAKKIMEKDITFEEYLGLH